MWEDLSVCNYYLLVGPLKEVDKLHDLELGLVATRDILEHDLVLGQLVDARRLGADHAEEPASLATLALAAPEAAQTSAHLAHLATYHPVRKEAAFI